MSYRSRCCIWSIAFTLVLIAYFEVKNMIFVVSALLKFCGFFHEFSNKQYARWVLRMSLWEIFFLNLDYLPLVQNYVMMLYQYCRYSYGTVLVDNQARDLVVAAMIPLIVEIVKHVYIRFLNE